MLKFFGAFVLGGVVRTPAVGVASREIQSLVPLHSPPGSHAVHIPLPVMVDLPGRTVARVR